MKNPTTDASTLLAFDLGQIPAEVPPERDDSTTERLYRAEVAAYYLRHDEVNEILDGTLLAGEDLARAECIRAELAIAKARVRDAENHGTNALLESSLAGWADLELRARLILVRAAVRAGRFEEARAELPGLRRDLVASGNELRVGMSDFLAGWCALKAGQYADAEATLTDALNVFERLGCAKYQTWARSALGILQTDLREWETANRHLAEAERLAADLGCAEGMLLCRSNAARALIAAGQIDEAIAALRDSLSWTWSEGQAMAAMSLRLLLAFALGFRRDPQAELVATELADLAGELSNQEMLLEAGLVRAWITGRVDAVRVLAREAERRHQRDAVRASRIYLADLTDKPEEAVALLDAVENPGVSPYDVLIDRVRERLASAPVRVEGSRLVVDLRGPLPNLDAATMTKSGGNHSHASSRAVIRRMHAA
jgi:tetratricopeptide (TPR) repeat protein